MQRRVWRVLLLFFWYRSWHSVRQQTSRLRRRLHLPRRLAKPLHRLRCPDPLRITRSVQNRHPGTTIPSTTEHRTEGRPVPGPQPPITEAAAAPIPLLAPIRLVGVLRAQAATTLARPQARTERQHIPRIRIRRALRRRPVMGRVIRARRYVARMGLRHTRHILWPQRPRR